MSIYLINNFPKIYEYYKIKKFTWDRTGGAPITQGNRNPILYKDMGGDGLKTGHLQDSGYSLAATTKKYTKTNKRSERPEFQKRKVNRDNSIVKLR